MAASKGAPSLGARLKAFIDSPTGPRTTHFWGPVANWGFVLAVRVVSMWMRGVERERERGRRRRRRATDGRRARDAKKTKRARGAVRLCVTRALVTRPAPLCAYPRRVGGAAVRALFAEPWPVPSRVRQTRPAAPLALAALICARSRRPHHNSRLASHATPFLPPRGTRTGPGRLAEAARNDFAQHDERCVLCIVFLFSSSAPRAARLLPHPCPPHQHAPHPPHPRPRHTTPLFSLHTTL